MEPFFASSMKVINAILLLVHRGAGRLQQIWRDLQYKLPQLGVSESTGPNRNVPTKTILETRELSSTSSPFDRSIRTNSFLHARHPLHKLPLSIVVIVGIAYLFMLAAKSKRAKSKITRARKLKGRSKGGELVRKTRRDSLKEPYINFLDPERSSAINYLTGYSWNLGHKISSSQADIEELANVNLDFGIDQCAGEQGFNSSVLEDLHLKKISIEEYLDLTYGESDDEEDAQEDVYQDNLEISRLEREEVVPSAEVEVGLICSSNANKLISKLRRILSHELASSANNKEDFASIAEAYLKELGLAIPRILVLLRLNFAHKLPIILLLRDYFLYSNGGDIEVKQFKACALALFGFIEEAKSKKEIQVSAKALCQVLLAIEEDMFNIAFPVICKSLELNGSECHRSISPILTCLKIILATSGKDESKLLSAKCTQLIIGKVSRKGNEELNAALLREVNEIYIFSQDSDISSTSCILLNILQTLRLTRNHTS